jgi:hypothetical protein
MILFGSNVLFLWLIDLLESLSQERISILNGSYDNDG